MKILKCVLLLIVLFSLLVSCTETVAPVLTGNISGFVSLYEENGSQVNDKSGVKVSIEGRNNYAYTNIEGRYEIENIDAGIFNIIFEKEGFCLYKRTSYQFVGGGDAYLYQISLTRQPSFNVESLDISKWGTQTHYLKISGSLNDVRNYTRYVILFFGKKENVSNNPQDYLLSSSIYVYPDSASFDNNWGDYENYFGEYGFNVGETVYVAAYSLARFYWEEVYDPLTGRYFYYGVGSSPVKSSFILD